MRIAKVFVSGGESKCGRSVSVGEAGDRRREGVVLRLRHLAEHTGHCPGSDGHLFVAAKRRGVPNATGSMASGRGGSGDDASSLLLE